MRMVTRYKRLQIVNHLFTAHQLPQTERIYQLKGINQHDWCGIDHFTRWSLASICAVISLWGFSIRVGLTYRHDSQTRLNEQIHITPTNEKTYTPTHIHQKFFLPLARTHPVIPGIPGKCSVLWQALAYTGTTLNWRHAHRAVASEMQRVPVTLLFLLHMHVLYFCCVSAIWTKHSKVQRHSENHGV